MRTVCQCNTFLFQLERNMIKSSLDLWFKEIAEPKYGPFIFIFCLNVKVAHEFPKSCEKIKICITRRSKLSSLLHELETLYIDSVTATEELDRISICTAVHADLFWRTSLWVASSSGGVGFWDFKWFLWKKKKREKKKSIASTAAAWAII